MEDLSSKQWRIRWSTYFPLVMTIVLYAWLLVKFIFWILEINGLSLTLFTKDIFNTTIWLWAIWVFIIWLWNFVEIFWGSPNRIEKKIKTRRIQYKEPIVWLIVIIVVFIWIVVNLNSTIQDIKKNIQKTEQESTQEKTTVSLDEMSQDERDDYLESLWFSTERSRENSNKDLKNRYAWIYDAKGNIQLVDKCENYSYYDYVDPALCKQQEIHDYPTNSSYSSNFSYIPTVSTTSYSSDEECTEPENPYDEYDEEWHYAGFERAERTGGSCDWNSSSFNEGCEEYYEQEEAYNNCLDK